MKNEKENEVSEALHKEICSSIEQLCKAIDTSGRADKLAAIGLITTDDVLTIGSFLRFEGDLPGDAEPYQLLSPVEWTRSEEHAFDNLNQYLASTRPPAGESDEKYRKRVHNIFETCAVVLEQLDLRRRYGSALFLTFTGVDPNPVLEAEEKLFVNRLNSSGVFEEWCNEFD